MRRTIGMALRVRLAASIALGALVLTGSLFAGASAAGAFGGEGEGAGQFIEGKGIAVAQESGEVYLADRNNNRIDKFQADGSFLLAWGWAVADGSSEELQTCTTTCFGGLEPFRGPGAGQFAGVEGIAVDNDPLSSSHNDVYVVDRENNRIQKFGPEGEFLLMFGGEVNASSKANICLAGEECQAGVAGTAPGFFERLNGRSIAVDSSGTVYVGDENRVQRFSGAGVQEGEIALPGAGFIVNLAVDSTGDIYIQSSELPGVRKYDGSGTELGSPRDEAGQAETSAITIGPADELFLNDFQEGRHHILAYDSAGNQTASFDSGSEAQDGKRGIAYSETAKAIYVLNEGAVRIVTPPPPGPLILEGSESASEIQPTTATLSALINPEGPETTTYHFEYGTSTAYGESTPETPLEGGPFEDQPASASLTGLEPSTTYHYRVIATNGTQTSTGTDHSFTTLPPVSIDATSVSEVNATSARLEGELNPHGRASEYRFEYGPTTAYGTSIPIPDATINGSTDVSVSSLIQGLLPSSTYHYRIVAHNELGSVEGPDRSFRTQGASSILPDGRNWELVSPPNKHGSPLEPLTEGGGLIQAAAGGGAIAYVALGPTDTDPKGVRSPDETQLLSTRGPGGWSTEDIATPHEEIAIIRVGNPSEYKFFSEDLRASAVEPQGATPLSPQTTERTPYRREADGEYVPLVSASNVLAGTEFGGEETEDTFGKSGTWTGGVSFLTATPDLSHAVLVSPSVLTAGFSPEFVPAEQPNLYELSGGQLQLISILPNEKPASEEGLASGVGRNDLNMRGAISEDGERVVFETGSGEHLWMRDTALEQTVQLDALQPGATGGAGKAVFQAAGSDGSKVLFTDTSRLTPDSTAQPAKPDLYMCEVKVIAGQLSCALSDLSVDHNAGEAANVRGEVAAIDDSAGHVYFAADGVLTSAPNGQGEVAVAGNCESEGDAPCNMYEYNTGAHQISLVAVLSSEDDPDWAGRTNLTVLGNLTARTSPDGRYLSFMSQRSLTGYDNRDARSGQADEEVFLFDSNSGKTVCASCDATGARPRGVFDKLQFPGLLVDHPRSWPERWLAGSIPGWTLRSLLVALHQSRYLSNSGRMFFNAADALVPEDTNSVEDVYQYEPAGVGDCSSSSTSFSASSGGCVNLVSSGSSKEESAFLDASEDGSEVFFLTASRLTPTDVDGAFDVYDAHICSSSSPCPPAPPPPAPACEGDACQNPSSAPGESTPGSLSYHGPENPPPPAAVSAVKVKSKPLTRAQKLAVALKACRRKPKGTRRVCERHARGKYGVLRATRSTHNNNRRAK